MKSDLKQRYIYAVIRNLPRGDRTDIERELSTLIDDMLEERCGLNHPTEKDLRVVLTELGTPAEMHRKYSPSSGKALIGENYYPQYKTAMTFVAAAVVFGMTVASLVLALLGERSWPQALAGWLGSSIAALTAGFTAITLLFAVLERRGVRIGLPSDTIENLPPVPKRGESIPRGESIGGLVLCVFFLLVLLAFPQVMGVTLRFGDGRAQLYSIFVPQALRAQWVWIVPFGLVGLARNVFRLLEGRHTMRMMAVTLICDVVSVPLACQIFLHDDLINPAFRQTVRIVMQDVPGWMYAIFDHFYLFFLGIILFALLLDGVTEVVAALRARSY